MMGAGCGQPSGGPEGAPPSQARQALESGPDFVVTAVSGPVSARPGWTFTTSVTVCNQGTQGDSTQVELYVSADTVISPRGAPNEDTYVAQANVHLAPGQCQTLAMSGSAWGMPDGAYHLGAVADPFGYRPELNESNNTRRGNRIGLGEKPEFVVTAVTGPTSLRPGQGLTGTVTVCNQGTQGDSTQVELYLSANNVITPPPSASADTPVGGAHVGYLAPGQCQTVSTWGSASVPDGAYYLGAVVDPNNGTPEFFDDNNGRAGPRIGVGHRPDFVVSSVTGPTSTHPGRGFSSSVTVCNQGTETGSTDVSLYVSTDATIVVPSAPSPTTDQPVAAGSTYPLHPGQCQTLSLFGSASVPTEGPYYLGAVADPHQGVPELLEDNNTRAGTRMGIGHRSDFVVTSVTGPTSAWLGEHITVAVTVCNQGTEPDSTEVAVYASADKVLTVSQSPSPSPDAQLMSAPTWHIWPGECQTLSLSGPAWVHEEGAYYLAAAADPFGYRTELLEDNNSRVGSRIGLGVKPDFVVTAVTGSTSARPGDTLTAAVTVCNQGMQGDSTEVELLLSQDSVIAVPEYPSSASDQPVTRMQTQYLQPGQCQTLSMSGSAWVPMMGPYYLGAVADPSNQRPELIEDNNSRAGTRLGIGHGSDFAISSVTGPVSALPGASITSNVVVCNRGTQPDSTRVELLVSQDNVFTPPTWGYPPSDYPIGSAYTQSLNPGQCQTLALSGSVWDGSHYLIAVADPSNERTELLEDNNARVGPRINVGHRPDFTVTTLTANASARPGDAFPASVTVCNQGTVGGETTVELYLSVDATLSAPGQPIRSSDLAVAYMSSGYLNAGQCQTLSMSGPAWEGTWYLGTVVDPYGSVQELNEDNNIKVGPRLSVGNRPDFVITSVKGPTSAQPGQPFTASVTACNHGTEPASTEVGLYLSTDATLIVTEWTTPASDRRLSSAWTNVLAPGQCQTLSLSGDTHPGTYYLGAAADPSKGVAELQEDNNSKAGNLISMNY